MKTFKISVKFGVLIALILIIYFVILGICGVNANPAYSVFNAVITASGIALALKDLKNKKSGEIRYREGFITALVTGIIATIIFSVFFITYYVYVPGFSDELLQKVGKFANTGGIFITVIAMGISTSFIAALTLMQLNKKVKYKKSSDSL